ncbi:MAG: Pyridoxal phosphate homeostasis protein [Prosthecobacter sp.]|nr:Pyridoxal phosphate homeostasis protein [Prosthecobacter sp.]
MSDIASRLEQIRERMTSACARAGRDLKSVELVAVSKTKPAELIQEAVDAGQSLFGENRVQEVMQKKPLLPSRLRWHLIGPLQSNKVRKILPLVEMIEAVDSLDIARDINRIAAELGLHPKVLLEINVATESSKHGFSAAQVRAQLEELYALDRLYIQGLMCIPPFDPSPEASRGYFIQLRTLREELEALGGAPLPVLSMGMSHDFETAIEEGASLVRVGTAIFGGR